MIKINLLPVRAERQKEDVRRQISVVVLSLFLISVIIGYLHISISKQITSIEVEMADINVKMEQFKKVIKEIDGFKEQKRVLEEKIKVMKRLNENKSGPLKLLSELSDIIPEKVWLESLKEKKALIEIKGIASDNKTIADFMNKIERSPVFRGVELTVSQQTTKAKTGDKGKGFKGFTLKFRLESRV
ncbi:MAG: PilN domain-containing protein [Thermodesulfobacteriota bacterium]